MKKLALFDFCDTLVNFQTADRFVDFVRMRNHRFYMIVLNYMYKCLVKFKILAFANKFFPKSSKGLGKKIKLLQLKGFSINYLDEVALLYYEEKIRPNLINPIILEMKGLASLNFDICILSAGYSIYLKYFVKEFNIRHLISTEIGFSQNYRCTGKINGKDCVHNEKVNRLKKHFVNEDINYNESISFSDSIDDLPMLLLTGNTVVVSRSESQNWSNEYNFKEILWET